MKLRNKESGFGTVEVVLILVIVLIIGVVGWLVHGHNHTTTQSMSSQLLANISPDKWTTFTNDAGHFSARFPIKPTYLTKSAQFEGVALTQYVFTAKDSTTEYGVSYIANSAYTFVPTQSQSVLDNSLHGVIQSDPGGRLISSSFTQIDGQQAEIFKYTAGAYYYSGESMLINHTEYFLRSKQLKTYAPNTDYFLSSFKPDIAKVQ